MAGRMTVEPPRWRPSSSPRRASPRSMPAELLQVCNTLLQTGTLWLNLDEDDPQIGWPEGPGLLESRGAAGRLRVHVLTVGTDHLAPRAIESAWLCGRADASCYGPHRGRPTISPKGSGTSGKESSELFRYRARLGKEIMRAPSG